MILCQCACGAGYALEAENAGATVECATCGQPFEVPDESASGLLLVRRGADSDAVVMRLVDIEAALTAGELTVSDEVLDDAVWRPLGELIDADADAPEQGVDAASMPGGSESLAPELDEEMVEASEGPPWERESNRPPVPRPPRGTTNRAIRFALGVVVAVVGYKYGVGPLVSSIRRVPTRVFVQNHSDTNYTALLGWRRMKRELPPNASCFFELFVGMPERQRLTLVPAGEEGERLTVRVPLRPGAAVLVNPGGRGRYGVFDLASAKERKVETAVAELMAQISANRAPLAATSVLDEMVAVGRDALKEVSTAVIFADDAYSLQHSAHYGGRTAVVQRELPVVVHPPSARVEFANGACTVSADKPHAIDSTITLPLTVLRLGTARTVEGLGAPVLAFRGDERSLALSMSIGNQQVRVGGTNFRGAWSYRATRALRDGVAGPWSWQWDYRGEATIGNRRQRLDLRVAADGEETQAITELTR